MDLIADGLLIATALTAALYCLVLSRRLRRLTDAQSGVGAQIGELSKVLEETRSTVTETRRSLAESRASARNAADSLAREVEAARAVVAELRSETALARRRQAARGPDGPFPCETPAERPPMPEELLHPVPEAPDPDDAIPDWPDGIVEPEEALARAVVPPEPTAEHGDDAVAPADPADPERQPPAAGAPASGGARGQALLRVERMAL